MDDKLIDCFLQYGWLLELRQEAVQLVFKYGLWNGFTSQGFYWDNAFQSERLGCLVYEIQPWVVGEGGLDIGVAYPVDFLNKFQPRSIISLLDGASV